MADREKFQNIKEKIRSNEMRFEDVCFAVISEKGVLHTDMVLLLLATEEIAFPGASSAEMLRHGERERSPGTFHSSCQKAYEIYEEMLGKRYSNFLYLLCVFLKEFSAHSFTQTASEEPWVLKKCLTACQDILFILQNRKPGEKQLGYICSEVLDMLLDVMKCLPGEISEELANTMIDLKRMEKQVVGIINMQVSLEPVIKMLKYVVEFAAKKGDYLVVSMLRALHTIEQNRKSLEISYGKRVCFLGKILQNEIRAWGMNLLSPACCYVDPAHPLLAGTFVIKPRISCTPGKTEKSISAYIDVILQELAQFIPYIYIRMTHLHIEVGETHSPVSLSSWNALCYIFNLEIVKCEIKFVSRNMSMVSNLLGSFFKSFVAQDMVSLSLHPGIPLNEKIIGTMVKSLKIKSLTLKESLSDGVPGAGVEDFLRAAFKRKDSIFLRLEDIHIVSLFQNSVVVGMQSIVFYGIKKLSLEFPSCSTYKGKPRRSITEIVKPCMFPALCELTVKNNSLTREDFVFLNVHMNLVQITYGKFYCPSGSSYIVEQKTYIFKKPLAVALNTGIVFIIAESIIHEWCSMYGLSLFSECLICKVPFYHEPKKSAVIMPCGSVSHINCIGEAFSKKKNPCCPFCKKKVHLVMGFPMAVDTMFRRLPDRSVSSLSAREDQNDGAL
ncbi:uncharacterized protein NEMAJ01_1724 [Nematocida major]|uniref:uncharacterized protein n=1 Tax=Nematocida major TaxID=1912982 RepID=UPI0020089D82|nr:uncharacterized protein NEMAJ01_1724 [Nematocida major]KAH9386828.1 hypothetical protein NEMAJ01_1724 [Nematocida major]